MTDIVWKYGEKVGTGFKCKYCREMKSGGGHAQMHAHITTSIPMCYFCFVDKYLFIVLVFLANVSNTFCIRLCIWIESISRSFHTCMSTITVTRSEYVSIMKYVDICVVGRL
jgi:hypothetical protein